MNMKWLGLIPLAIWMCVCGTAQTRPDRLGTIRGVVVDSETGEPVTGTAVNLDTAYHVFGRMAVTSTKSDGKGVFSIRVEPNEYYFLSARKQGYLHDGAVPEPQMFSLDEGEQLTDIVLKLTREGVVRGRLSDADGDLVGRPGLTAWQWRFAGGDRYLESAGQVQVRPDGTFLIENLASGNTYLRASRGWEFADYGSRPRMDAALPTFYRSATDAASAESVHISPGAEIDGIELRMRRGMLYRVQGAVSGPSGFERASLTLCCTSVRQFCLATLVKANGRFTIDNVPAGEYEIRGEAFLRTPQPQSLRARKLVTVGAGLADIDLAFSKLPEITTVLHGGHARFQLYSVPEHGSTADLIYTQDVTPRSVPVYPGRYQIGSIELPEDRYVESVRSGEKDVSGGFEVTTANVSLDIVLAAGAAKLSGTVRDAQEKPLEDVPVTLWTEADGVRSFSETTMSDEDGHFVLTNLKPGEYRIAAWQGTSKGMAEYRGFLQGFGKDSAALSLSAGESREIKLIAIDEKASEAQAAKVR